LIGLTAGHFNPENIQISKEVSMANHYSHARLLGLPVTNSPAAGLLDAVYLDTSGIQTNLLLDYHELQHTSQPQLFEREGRPWERGQGKYFPRRLRFVDTHIIKGDALLTCLEGLPREDPTRLLNAVLAWRSTDGQNYYLFDLRRQENDTLLFTASRCLAEPRQDLIWETPIERDWSPPPLSPPRLIPDPKSLRHRFSGDPVTVRLEEVLQHRRLFIGGLDTQTNLRPNVAAVLNLGEDASLWTLDKSPHPADRWAHKGEGSKGMSVEELVEEADWVIAHLNKGERVLAHCSAGMNRSSSLCCAVLIRLEGIPAEAALERVREHHPWARPDPRHWLALRWLASQ
jgi:hypothetical protein